MRPTVANGLAQSQTRPVDRMKGERDQWLALLRQAVAETGWCCDALDAEWGVSHGYAWRLLQGERPWSADRYLSLPNEIEARHTELLLEQKHGGIAVKRMTEAEVLAQLHRSAALLSVKAGQQMAKAEVAPMRQERAS